MAGIRVFTFENTSDGIMTNLIQITNSSGASVTLCDFGATIISVKVPDKNRQLRDVVLGYSHLKYYDCGGTFFGAVVGRCCGRIGRGRFVLNGREYYLPLNNGNNHLHGGWNNFSRKVWNYEIKGNKVVFYLESPDNDQGYPGNMKIWVSYEFDDNCTLRIEYSAVSDKDTICNLTNHSYFNLNGHGSGDVLNHSLKINAEGFVGINRELIPTGDIIPVKNTPFDFTSEKTIGGGLAKKDGQLEFTNGFDHAFVLNNTGAGLQYAATAKSADSGITLECRTTCPVIHLYTANYMKVNRYMGKDGASYGNNGGFCFETQGFPDAVNHPEFPSVVLKKDEKFYSVTEFDFSCSES